MHSHLQLGLLIWDFDGTLGYREGGAWTASLFEVARRAAPDREVTHEQLQPYTQSGFPWLSPEVPHPELLVPGHSFLFMLMEPYL